MNSSSAGKSGKIVSRVTPSNVSSKLRSSEKNDDEIELEEVQAQQPRPGTSRDAVISAMENSGTRPVADPGASNLLQGTPPRTPQQQNDLDEDMDQIIAEIMDSSDEGKETAEHKLKKLQKKASALREKKKSFDSENSSPTSSSVKKYVRPREQPLPEPLSGGPQEESPPHHPEDPDKIISVPDGEGGGRSRANGSGWADVQKFKKKEADRPSSVRRRDHVSIEMGFINEAMGNETQRNPTYLETYVGYMFNCCLSPFRPEGSTGGVWGYCIKFCLVQVIIYWAITIVAILTTLANSKFTSLRNIADGGLENFTNMCFFIMNSCLQIYSAYLFTVQQQRFAKMIQSLARLREFAALYSNEKPAQYQTWKVLLLFLVSMTVSILSVIFTTGLLGWTLENTILHYSFKMAMAAYVWTPAGASINGTQTAMLDEEFGETMTGSIAMIGVIGLVAKLCTRVIANAMSDLIVATATTIEKEMDQLAKDVGNPVNDIHPVTMENFEAEDGQWKHFLLLQQVVDDTNDTFDSLLRYIHVENLMLLVLFVLNVFDGEFSFFLIVHYVYNILKAGYTYRIAAKAAGNNEIFQEWIRRLIGKSADSNFTRNAQMILDRMKTRLLGLGRGQFLIDEAFLFRFVGAFGSVFVLQAQSREAAMSSEKTK